MLICFLLPAIAVAQEALQLVPQTGVLLLRNGNVMQGEITRAGDHYILTIGAGGEIKIAAKEVETQSKDLESVYDWKLRRLTGDGASPHLDLAEWCLRHQLYRHCAEQLSLALATDPTHKRIEPIDRRLQLALQAPAPPKTPASSTGVVGPEQLDKMLRELPKGSLERFTTIVQPMLSNRCATAQCHGSSSHNGLQLLRPPTGIGSPTRFTHRNLYSALQFVDRDDPANSPLLTKPQEPHGGGTTAVFDLRSRGQMFELQVWIEQLANRREPAVAPATIDPQTAQYSPQMRPSGPGAATGVAQATHATELPPPAPDSSAPGKTTPGKLPQGPPQPADRTSWKPRDPFDAEIFNRLHESRR